MNDSRQHILDTALGLFLRRSYKDVTLSDIVNSTGLSEGAFYHYFESKEMLLREVVEQLLMDHVMPDMESLRSMRLEDLITEHQKDALKQFAGLSQISSPDVDINYYALMFEAA